MYDAISTNSIAVLFFGTPHRGSDKTTYGSILATVASTVSHRAKSSTIKALEVNSDELIDLTDRFRFRLKELEIFSFYETRPTQPFTTPVSAPVVDGNS